MKKIISILLALGIVAAAAGCSSADSEDAVVNETKAAGDEAAEIDETEDAQTQEETEAAAVEQEEITISHKLGDTTLMTNPERVVVLDYGIVDALDYVDVDAIVGLPRAHVPEHLSKYDTDEYEDLGHLVETNFEAINKLDPDLIIITSRFTDSYDDFSDIAPTLFMAMPGTDYLATLEENLEILGQIFTAYGDDFAAEMAEIKERFAAISEAAAGKAALLIQTNDDSISVFGYGSRYSAIYSDFGFTVTDESIEESSHGQNATFEYVAEQNPEYLFVIDRSAAISTEGATGAEVLLENSLIEDMDAAQNDKIFFLDSTNWYTVAGGIQSTFSMIEEIEEALGL